MKKDITLLFFATILPLQSLWAQHYSIEELTQGFYAQYVEKSSVGQMEMGGMDMLMYANEEFGNIKQSSNKTFLCFNEELHKIGDINLPPSVFVEIFEMTNSESRLYWYSTRDSSNRTGTDKLRDVLLRTYGGKQLPGGAVLVPARWFSGELYALHKPFLYGNVPVSRYSSLYRIEKGVFSKNEQGNSYAYDCDHAEIEFDAWAIAKTTTSRYHEVGPEDDKLSNYRTMTLFSREVTRNLDVHLLPEDMERSYAIMLHLDDYDRLHLYPLLPKELTIDDKLLLTILGNAIEQQPAHTFGKLRSARGPYPAVFLWVHFKRRRWFFKDYKYIE